MASAETLAAAHAAVSALTRVLLGDGERDRGLLPKRTPDGASHLEQCNVGMWLYAGDSLRGGQPCSVRCQQAREALVLAQTYLELVVAEMDDARPVQPRLLEAV